MNAVVSPTVQASKPAAVPSAMRIQQKYLPLTATISLFVVMATLGSVFYTGFFAPQVFLNLFIDNAFLIICAVGMTLSLIHISEPTRPY